MKKYIIKTFPVMVKEYIVEAKNPTEALDTFYHDPEGNKVSEHGVMEYTDFEDMILPEVMEASEQLTYNPLTKGYRIAYNSYHNRKENK